MSETTILLTTVWAAHNRQTRIIREKSRRAMILDNPALARATNAACVGLACSQELGTFTRRQRLRIEPHRHRPRAVHDGEACNALSCDMVPDVVLGFVADQPAGALDIPRHVPVPRHAVDDDAGLRPVFRIREKSP